MASKATAYHHSVRSRRHHLRHRRSGHRHRRSCWFEKATRRHASPFAPTPSPSAGRTWRRLSGPVVTSVTAALFVQAGPTVGGTPPTAGSAKPSRAKAGREKDEPRRDNHHRFVQFVWRPSCCPGGLDGRRPAPDCVPRLRVETNGKVRPNDPDGRSGRALPRHASHNMRDRPSHGLARRVTPPPRSENARPPTTPHTRTDDERRTKVPVCEGEARRLRRRRGVGPRRGFLVGDRRERRRQSQHRRAASHRPTAPRTPATAAKPAAAEERLTIATRQA